MYDLHTYEQPADGAGYLHGRGKGGEHQQLGRVQDEEARGQRPHAPLRPQHRLPIRLLMLRLCVDRLLKGTATISMPERHIVQQQVRGDRIMYAWLEH